jgi:hypothetical protein
MNSDDAHQLLAAARRIMQRRLEAKQLMLTCQRCREYFECTRYEPFCDECREARRAT